MINLNSTIKPLILVQAPHLNTFELKELIHEYLIEHADPSHNQGIIEPIFDPTDHQRHSNLLYEYIQKHSKQHINFEQKKGFFYSPLIGEHSWIQSKNLIIDITITRFNHFPQIDEELWNTFGGTSYFISDHIDHPLYRLYHEDL